LWLSGAGLPGGLELRHQLVDALAGDREVFDQDRRAFVVLGEHRVVALAGLAPQAEFGAQAEVLQRRVEDGGSAHRTAPAGHASA
jgi:hypothetical protein